MTQEINSNNDKWWFAAIIVVALMWILNAFWNPVRAQRLDTIRIDVNNIERIVEKPTTKTVRYYAIYKDSHISDVIPIGKSVIEHIEMYKEYGIKPSLGLKLRDGKVVSIIKIPKRYGTR